MPDVKKEMKMTFRELKLKQPAHFILTLVSINTHKDLGACS